MLSRKAAKLFTSSPVACDFWLCKQYPEAGNEALVVHQFIRGLRIDTSGRNLLCALNPVSMQEALATASRMVSDSLEVDAIHLAGPARSWETHKAATNESTRQQRDVAPGPATQCFKCDEYGHWARDCPIQRREARCAFCSRTGHVVSQCRQRSQQQQSQNRGEQIPRCQLCGLNGHGAIHCKAVKITAAKMHSTSGFLTAGDASQSKTIILIASGRAIITQRRRENGSR